MSVACASTKTMVDEAGPPQRPINFLHLPFEVLAGQLRACSGTDLAAFNATARQPKTTDAAAELSLPAFVARELLGSVAKQWASLAAAHWLRLFQFLQCAEVVCFEAWPLIGRLCPQQPEFIRCGAIKCEM